MRLFAFIFKILLVKTDSSYLLCDNLDKPNAERATLEISYMKTFCCFLVLVIAAHTEKKVYTKMCERNKVYVSPGC